LFHLEHKSRPSRTVALQLLAEVGLSLHFRWLLNKRPESGTFEPPIPLMVVVYNGTEDWEGEIWFQDLFPNLPERLRLFVPQFRVFLINLRRFKYGNLPGRPETRAIVESMMRATDGTFIEHLPEIFTHVAQADFGEHQRLDLTQNISSYCTWSSKATSEQIVDAITSVFRGQEANHMIETINNKWILEGFKIGEVSGKTRWKAEGEAIGLAKGKVQAILEVRFNKVPKGVENTIQSMTDLIALESLVEYAKFCKSLDDFAEALQ